MKSKFYLLIAMVLLLGLLPAAAVAAPPKPPYVSVRDWTLPLEWWPATARLSAWDINWRLPGAAYVEIGYVSCADFCETVVEATYKIARDDKYPQDLDLAGKVYHQLDSGNCTLQQFVRILDRKGAIVATAWSQEDNICIDTEP